MPGNRLTERTTMDTLEREITADLTITEEDDQAHDRFAHYVRKTDIERATFEKVAVTAICGKVWVADKAPGKYGVCPRCKEIYEGLPQGD
jgi:rubrerythrin